MNRQILLMVWGISAVDCKMQYWRRQPIVLISYSHDQSPNQEEGALIFLHYIQEQYNAPITAGLKDALST